jgi:endonuclease YncB( thermonuclease family)
MIDKINSIRELYRNHGNNTPYFSLKGMKTYARVIDVYDGDTITIVIDVNNFFLKFKCRLNGIDTCEIRSKNTLIKQLAVQAKNRLFNLITNHTIDELYNKKELIEYFDKNVSIIWVHCLDFDKYGRLLIDCSSSPDAPKSFSQILIDEKLACSYDGDTKLTEEQQLLYFRNG